MNKIENIIPQVTLYNLIQETLTEIRDQIKNNVLDNESLLGIMFSGINFGKSSFLKDSKNIFSRDELNARYVDARLSFDRNRVAIPTIHITTPSETQISQGIGNHFNSFGKIDLGGGRYRDSYSRAFNCNYNIVITSDNVTEVVIIYHVIRNMLISEGGNLELLGLQNMTISSQEISPYSELLPPNIYMKIVGLTFTHWTVTPDFEVKSTYETFNVNLKAVK